MFRAGVALSMSPACGLFSVTVIKLSVELAGSITVAPAVSAMYTAPLLVQAEAEPVTNPDPLRSTAGACVIVTVAAAVLLTGLVPPTAARNALTLTVLEVAFGFPAVL